MEGSLWGQSFHWCYGSHALPPSHLYFPYFPSFLLSWILFIFYTCSNHSHVIKVKQLQEWWFRGLDRKMLGCWLVLVSSCWPSVSCCKRETIITHACLHDNKKEIIYSFIERPFLPIAKGLGALRVRDSCPLKTANLNSLRFLSEDRTLNLLGFGFSCLNWGQ